MSTKKSKAGKKPAGRAKAGAPSKPRKSAKAVTPRKARKAASGSTSNGQAKRLRPGQLDGLVLGFMRKNEKDLPMSPGTIAKGIGGRSSGAVGNCLERLAKAKKARFAKKTPREYDLKGVDSR